VNVFVEFVGYAFEDLFFCDLLLDVLLGELSRIFVLVYRQGLL